MNITYCDDYQSLSLQAKELILAALQQKKDSLFCVATGASPLGAYQLLASTYEQQPALFEQVRLLKLDEWGGVPMQEPQTCEVFLQKYLIQPLRIPASRYFGFNSDPENPQLECDRIQAIIEQQGPIDLCLLGLGSNGHVAFNEPGEFLLPQCHIAALSGASLQHSMAKAMRQPPAYGMTIGMGAILSAKKVILLISGNNKRQATEKLLQKRIATQLPASFLWLHPAVECVIDNQVFE